MPRKRQLSLDTVRAVTVTLIETGTQPSIRAVQARTGGGSATLRAYLKEIDAQGLWAMWLKGHARKVEMPSDPTSGTETITKIASALAELKTKLAAAELEIKTLRMALAELKQHRQENRIDRPMLSEDHPFFGLSIPEAAAKQLSLIGEPSTARQVTNALQAGGYYLNNKDPESAVRQGLKRMAQRGADVVLVSRGKWALKAWCSPDDINSTDASPGNVNLRDFEHHREQVRAAQRLSRNNGVQYGRLTFEQLYDFNRIIKLRQLIDDGYSPREATEKVGMPLSTFRKYRSVILDSTKTRREFYEAAEKIRTGQIGASGDGPNVDRKSGTQNI